MIKVSQVYFLRWGIEERLELRLHSERDGARGSRRRGTRARHRSRLGVEGAESRQRASGQPVLVRVHDGLRAVTALCLGEDPVDVRLHRRLTEVERCSDLVVGQAAPDVGEDFRLTVEDVRGLARPAPWS